MTQHTPSGRPLPSATIEDLLSLPEDERYELIDGTLVQKAVPFGEHSLAQGGVISSLVPAFQRSFRTQDGTGGWWILPEIDIRFEARELYRPDVAGWRRERMPTVPRHRLIEVPPDWVCEVLSDSTARYDLNQKLRTYHRHGVGHYWVIRPVERTLTVFRRNPLTYELVFNASVGDVVRAEPFQAIELNVTLLLGEDEEPPPPST